MQIGNIENDLCPHSELVKLIVGLIDLINVDRAVTICFDWEKQEVLFTVIKCLTYNIDTSEYKNLFILSMFKESVTRC